MNARNTLRLMRLLPGWRAWLRNKLRARRPGVLPPGRAADCSAVLGLRELDRQLMSQLSRAVGLSEHSALALVERVGGLRGLSARLIGYLEQARTQSDTMQRGIDQNSRIVGELAAFVRALPHQVAQERSQFQRLLAEVGKLTEVTDTLRGIARQTEILAINGAIEAARAGEGGRGFAVLAGEMRRLATQSNASAAQINRDIAVLMQTVEVSYSGEFEARTRHNEAEAERLSKLTLELDESYGDMRQFYQGLMGAVSQHNSELDQGLGLLLDTAQYQDVVKQIVDRAQPALESRHAVLAELIARLRAGQHDTAALDAQACALAPEYLALEAAHRDPEAAAGSSPGTPASRIELF